MAILKIEKSQYLHNRLADFGKILYWSVFTNIKQSVDCVVDAGFRKYISSMQVLTFEFLISKLISNAKGALGLT